VTAVQRSTHSRLLHTLRLDHRFFSKPVGTLRPSHWRVLRQAASLHQRNSDAQQVCPEVVAHQNLCDASLSKQASLNKRQIFLRTTQTTATVETCHSKHMAYDKQIASDHTLAVSFLGRFLTTVLFCITL